MDRPNFLKAWLPGILVLSTSTVFAATLSVPAAPTGLRSEVYSRTAAELFWDRPESIGLVYDVLRDGRTVATTDGTSYFDDALSAGQGYAYEVIAIDREGRRSPSTGIALRTQNGVETGPSAPTGLRSEVYSQTAAELFWNRPTTFGLVYDVVRDGRTLARTDGTSYFDDTLAAGRQYAYEVVAIDRQGLRSSSSGTTLRTPDGDGVVPESGDDPSLPSAFRTIEALVDITPLDNVERIDIDASRSGSLEDGYGLMSLEPGNGTPRIGVRRRLSDVDLDEFLAYDPLTGGIETLLRRSPLTSPTLSRDLRTAAWIEGCLGYVQQLDDGSDPVLLNPLLRANTCLRPPALSAAGDTVVFGAARGRVDANGELSFEAFDNRQFGPIVYAPATGLVTSLAGVDITLDDLELSTVDRVDYPPLIAANGSRVIMRTAFLSGSRQEPSTSDIVAGIFVVDPVSGDVDLVARHADQRVFCRKCSSRFAEDLVVSGDGRYGYLMRTPEDAAGDTSIPTQLYRHDLRRNASARVPTDDVVVKNSLVTDGDGNRVAYLSQDDGPVVLRVDTGERVLLDRALRGCVGDECEFASYRFVQSTPLSFSADGSVLLIRVIPERAGIDTPQNTSEVLVLDVEALAIRRAAPGIDTLVAESSDDGSTIVLEPERYSVGSDDGTDLLLIRRE